MLRLITLMLCPFAFSTTGGVMTGLLAPMSADLGVSIELLGQLQAAFAITCGLAGPFIARLTVKYDRKYLLLGVLFALILINILSAVAGRFDTLLAIRIIGGVAASLTLPLASGLVFALTEPEKRPGTIAFVISGNTFALLIGAPLGSVIGSAYGWETAFMFAAILSLVALLLVSAFIPTDTQTQAPPKNAFKTALSPRCVPFYVMTLLAFTSMFTVATFIGPVITASAGVTGALIGALQALVGVGGLVGLAIGAKLARNPETSPFSLSFAVLGTSLATFSLAMTFDMGAFAVAALVIAIPLGTIGLFSMSPSIQTRLGMETGAAVTIAFAINSSMIFLGQGLGGIIGGLVSHYGGLTLVGFAGAAIALMGAVATFWVPSVFSGSKQSGASDAVPGTAAS